MDADLVNIVMNYAQASPVLEMNGNVVGSKVKTLWPNDNKW